MRYTFLLRRLNPLLTFAVLCLVTGSLLIAVSWICGCHGTRTATACAVEHERAGL